ncbi:MAG: YicC family protein [Thermoanaerobaculia bacterium]|nr:YicC family protein [Thermoanaerobaculia bacterium]
MRSMTGFGQAVGEQDGLRISVTVRSVNHRYLDLALRLRDDRPEIERKVRELVATRVERGRLDLSVEVETSGIGAARARVDAGLMDSVEALVEELSDRGLINGGVRLGDLLRIPELVKFERGADWTEEAEILLLDVIGEALDGLVTTRSEEGLKLTRMLLERVEGLEAVRREMQELAAELPSRQAVALRQRLDQLLGENVEPLDEQRVAQEAAILADRSDVAEELDRLGAHLEQFRVVCDQQGSAGKRLDFLAQEIFRELNTIGSKCRDSDLKRCVVDGKVLCEQLREQVQNVE